MKRLRVIATFVVLVILTGCSTLKDNEMVLNSQHGTLVISLSQRDVMTLDKGAISVQSIQTPAFIDIKIEHDDIASYTNVIPLYDSGDGYLCEPILLQIGDHRLTRFIVLDDQHNPLYAFPVTEPVDFTIQEDLPSIVNPVVYPLASFSSSADYGLMDIAFTIESPTFIPLSVLKSFDPLQQYDEVTVRIGVIPSPNQVIEGDVSANSVISISLDSFQENSGVIINGNIVSGSFRFIDETSVIKSNRRTGDLLFFGYKELTLTDLVTIVELEVLLKHELNDMIGRSGAHGVTFLVEGHIGESVEVLLHEVSMSELEQEDQIVLYGHQSEPLDIALNRFTEPYIRAAFGENEDMIMGNIWWACDNGPVSLLMQYQLNQVSEEIELPIGYAAVPSESGVFYYNGFFLNELFQMVSSREEATHYVIELLPDRRTENTAIFYQRSIDFVTQWVDPETDLLSSSPHRVYKINDPSAQHLDYLLHDGADIEEVPLTSVHTTGLFRDLERPIIFQKGGYAKALTLGEFLDNDFTVLMPIEVEMFNAWSTLRE